MRFPFLYFHPSIFRPTRVRVLLLFVVWAFGNTAWRQTKFFREIKPAYLKPTVIETQGGENRWREVNLCRQSGKSQMTFGSVSSGCSTSTTLQRLRDALALMRAGFLTVLSSASGPVANGITSQKSTATTPPSIALFNAGWRSISSR